MDFSPLNTTGSNNTADGFQALNFNIAGVANTATGSQALRNNKGSNNVGLGASAGSSVTHGPITLSVSALNAVSGANVANSCWIGQIYSNMQPIVGTDPDSVTITSTGRLGRGNVSSRRYKHDIKPMDKASEGFTRSSRS